MRIVLFSTAREAVGARELRCPVPESGASLRGVIEELRTRHPELRAILPACRFARDGEYLAIRTARVSDGDEIAIHPPYSGG